MNEKHKHVLDFAIDLFRNEAVYSEEARAEILGRGIDRLSEVKDFLEQNACNNT